MGQDDEANDHRPENYGKRTAAGMLPLLLRLRSGCDVLLCLVGRKTHLLDDCVSAGLDAAAIIGRVLFEVRQYRLTNDDARHRVGHESTGAITGRDPYLVLVRRD